MGTRGAYGFRVDGVDKVTYNQFDSYPDCLGFSVLEFISKSKSFDELKSLSSSIVLVNNKIKPTPEQIEENLNWSDKSVRTGELEDWYVLLRNAQGDLNALHQGLKYMIDNHNFLFDSLFCEYAYIINIDEGVLEFYKGFNRSPNGSGRYAIPPDDYYKDGQTTEYYGVNLLQTFNLSEIINASETELQAIVKKMNCLEAEDDEEEELEYT